MINKPPPLKDLFINTRIPIIIPIKGSGFINHGSGLAEQGLGFQRLGDLKALSDYTAPKG